MMDYIALALPKNITRRGLPKFIIHLPQVSCYMYMIFRGLANVAGNPLYLIDNVRYSLF